MFRITLIIIAALLAPSFASAVTCTSVGGTHKAWTVQGQTGLWDVGACGADDDYIITSTSHLTLAASIGVRTLTVDSADATFNMAPGSKITFFGSGGGATANYVHCKTGACNFQGSTVWTGELTSVTFAVLASRITVGVSPPPVAGLAGKYLKVLDDDSSSLNVNVAARVQIGEGQRDPEKYRPSYAKWRWYRIISVDAAASTMVLSYDEFTDASGFGVPGAYSVVAGREPYVGTRDVGLSASYPVNPTAIWETDARGQFAWMDVAEAAINLSEVTGDFAGRHYVRWVEGACLGRHAKIIQFMDEHSLNTDRIYIAGDPNEMGCADDNWEITDGLRAGDSVAVINPVTIDGNLSSSTAGSIPRGVIFDHGAATSNVDNMRVVRMQGLNPGSLGMYPNIHGNFNCITCLLNSSVTHATTPTASNFASRSSYRNIEVGWAHLAGGNASTELFGLMCSMPSYSNPPPGGVLWDTAGMKIEGLYLHDAIDANTGNPGLRGFSNNGCNNSALSRSRIERTTSIAYLEEKGDFGTGDGVNSKAYHLVTGDILPGTPRTSACHLIYNSDLAAGGTGYADTSNRSEVRDLFGSGCGAHQVYSTAVGTKYYNVAVGGNEAVGEMLLASGIVRTTAQWDATQNEVHNSLLYLFGGDRIADKPKTFNTRVFDTISVASPDATDGIVHGRTDKIERSFFNGINSEVEPSVADSDAWPSRLDIVDTVFSQLEGKTFNTVPLYASDYIGLANYTHTRVYHAFHGLYGDGYLSQRLATSSPTTINATFTDSTYTTNGGPQASHSWTLQASTSSGLNVTGSCFETDGSQAEFSLDGVGTGWTAASGTRHVPGLGIGKNDSATLRAYLRQPGAVGCEAAKPAVLGLAALSVSHTMFGDGVVAQWVNYSSRDRSMGGGGGTEADNY